MARRPKDETPSELSQLPEQMLAVIFQSFTPEEIEALRSRVLDCALGVRLALRAPRAAGPREGESYEAREDEDGEVWHVYTRGPDVQMLNLLFSHAFGRPGSRKVASIDPVIEVRHFVPGFVTVPTLDEERLQADPSGQRISPGAGGSWHVRNIADGEGKKTEKILDRIRGELAKGEDPEGMGDAIPTTPEPEEEYPTYGVRIP